MATSIKQESSGATIFIHTEEERELISLSRRLARLETRIAALEEKQVNQEDG